MKSEKILKRIENIKVELYYHRKNIKRLKVYARRSFKNKKFDYAPRVVKYSNLPRSEKTYHETLNNLSMQVSLLERELEVLKEYSI